MPIDRTAYNALVNETTPGSGSIWDKTAIKDVLLDPIDTAIAASSGAWTIITNTATGATNNWAPAGLSGNTLIKWNGASDAQFTGLAAGVTGQRVTVKNITAAKIATFASQSASSSAGNKFTNFATSAPTPIFTNGSITWQYDGIDWLIVDHDQGAWITPAYAAGDFTGKNAMTWTVDSGDIQTYRYWLKGRTLFVTWVITATTVGGTLDAELRIKIPGGFTSAQQHTAGMMYKDNGGAWTFAAAWVNVTSTNIGLYTAGFGTANWAASTNATGSYGGIAIEVS